MADRVVQVTQQGWGSRLGASIKGVFVGLLLAVGGPALLFWNEGRAVHRAQALAEGAGAVVEAPAAAVAPGLDGKVVHVTGTANTAETLKDPLFGVAQPALALERKVEMYQWQEKAEHTQRKKLGGSTETVTTYTYSRGWSGEPLDSSSFQERSGHENPAFPFRGEEWRAADVKLGAWTLAPELTSSLDRHEDLAVGASELQGVDPQWRGKLQLADGGFYLGAAPASPALGDVRVRFSVVRPAAVSIVAGANGAMLVSYHTHAGGDLALVEYGTKPAVAMFESARSSNRNFTWLLRLGGFIVLFAGIRALLGPLQIFADVVPLFGRIAGFGLGIVAFLVAAPVALVTIAIGWLFYRPGLGIALMAAAAAIVVWLIVRLRKPKLATAVPAFVPPPPPAPVA